MFILLLTFLIVFTKTLPLYSNLYTNTISSSRIEKPCTLYTYNSQLDDTIKTVSKVDSISYKKSSMSFDYPVYYDAEDSLLFDFKKQKAFLYGKAVVIYESVNLTAEFVQMDFENNEVLAYGLTDSTGQVIGKPVFKDNAEEFDADTIRYNFRTKKGIIKEVMTEFEGSYLHGSKTKMQPDKHVHMIDGKFTTCDLEHPHYYFAISKAIVIPDDKIISGPAFLVIEDIPTPLGIPFGFFPNKKGGSSGIIIPEFGEEANRGYFLRNGGYYWAINDFVDLTVLGDGYTKGSWGLSLLTNYKVKYKFSGSLNAKYSRNVLGYKDINYQREDLYAVKWRYVQDPKARPNSNFSADVNVSSSKFDKYNSYNAANYMSTNKTSSISYSQIFPNSPFSLTSAFRHNQNNSTGAITLTLPDLAINMSRIYPFKRKVKVGESKLYEKIGIAYSMNLTNQIQTSDSSFFDFGFDNITNGISHRIPISTSVKFLKYTTLTPSFNYTERWYSKSAEQSWVFTDSTDSEGKLLTEYQTQFSRVWDYSVNLKWSTQIYGTFNFKKGNLKAIRHVMSPSISYNYLPDYGQRKYNYYDEYYRIQYNGTTGQYDTIGYIYSRFQGLPYGTPSRGGAGSINLNIGNNLEMKLRNKNDTVAQDRKIKLLENLTISTTYNIMADSLNLAPLTINGRTKIKLLDLTFNTSLDPYAIMENDYGSGVRINQFAYNVNNQLLRLTIVNLNAGFSLNSKMAESKAHTDIDPYQTLYGYPDQYVDFDIPWNVRVNYTFRYTKPYFESNITQTVNVTGDFNLTKKWKISFTSGYDIVNKKATYSTIDVYRDLHCWEASLHLVPFGEHKSYMFQINVKASMLKDLKLAKRRSWFDNF
ncbi:MAG: putative LPS assembly protein LptD [Bacteroidales bacterium]|nr:putative LPS assembly protein LptD [Bacteroidales bacterium]